MKQLWESLARTNAFYYICSDYGKKITEKQFRSSGFQDYLNHIFYDTLIRPEGTIVEIGCGIGRMTEFIANAFDRVIGTDISGGMIRKGKERMKDLKNVELYETDGQTIPVEDASVDYVFSFLVFQHIKTYEMVEKNFMEAYRILKPGGLFKVLLRTDKINEMEKWWAGVHYDNNSARQLCRSVGFRVVKLEQVKTYAMWLWLIK